MIEEMILEKIESCAREIGELNGEANLNNKPYMPNIFIYLGRTVKYAPITKKSVDTRWRKNCKYITHLALSVKEDGFSAEIVGGTMDFHDCENAYQVLDELFIQALKAPIGTFSESRKAKIAFVLDASDENFEKLYQIAASYNTAHADGIGGITLFKDMFLLLRQGGTGTERKTLKNNLRIVEASQEKNDLRQIYFLSNRLNNGTILDAFKEKENYRIIGDVEILTNNDDENRATRFAALYVDGEKYKTVSYRIAEKPCTEIVLLLMRCILKQILAGKEQERSEFKQKVEKDQFEEEYFDEVFASTFSEAKDFKYLPYKEGALQELEKAFRESSKNSFGKIDERMLDEATQGCYSAFFKKNYGEKLIGFDKDAFKKRLKKHIYHSYSFKDILAYFEEDFFIDTSCKKQETDIRNTRSNSIYEAMKQQNYNKARNAYFDIIRKLYEETVRNVCDEAKAFEKMLEELELEFRTLLPVTDVGICENLERFYSLYAENYFAENEEKVCSCINMQMNTEEKLLDALVEAFNDMRKKDSQGILSRNFLNELAERLNKVTPERRMELLRNTLFHSGIDNMMRLFLRSGRFGEGRSYCFFDYKSEILDTQNMEGGIDTKDPNSFEHLKVYSFADISDILGNRTEECEDDADSGL